MTFPNVTEALGSDAGSIIRAAAAKHIARLVGPLQLTDDQREQAVSAMEWALDYWMDVILNFINSQGTSDSYGTQNLCFWSSSVRSWIADEELADELLRTMLYPEQEHLPRAEILEASRERAKPLTPPDNYAWPFHALSFRRGMEHRGVLPDDLRICLKEVTGL